MERYGNLDLDLECHEGAVSQKASLFSGIFKKSSKSKELLPSAQAALTLQNPELSASNDSLTSKSKDKSGVLGGLQKLSPKPRHVQRSSQDLKDVSASNDNLSEDTNAKEDLSTTVKIIGSNDNLPVNSNTKETSSSMFKKSPHPQEDSAAPDDLSGSNDKNHTKDDLSVDDELLAGNDSAVEKSSKGGVAKVLRSPFTSSSQDKEKTDHSGDSQENSSATGKPKTKEEKSSNNNDEKKVDHGNNQPTQNRLAGGMTKLNPFRYANKNEKEAGSIEEDLTVSNKKSSGHKQKDTEDAETLKENEKEVGEKSKPEVKGTSSHDKVKPRRSEDNNEGKDMTSRERKEKPAKPPAVPARPSEEELNRIIRHSRQEQNNQQDATDDEGLKADEESASKDEKNEEEGKGKKEAASDDVGLNADEESASKEETNKEEVKEEMETKVKKKKKHNPFMPDVKAKVIQRRAQETAQAESEGANRSVFDQLEDYRIGTASTEHSNDVDLMEWWETVEQWKDPPHHKDMTEKEEAKAFALTAEKLQKGIRVFNKLFTERAESLWKHVIDLNSIADGLDKFSKNTKIAQITGGSTSAVGGVATVAGLALAPFTMGTSLIVTAVGLGIAAAGGLTSAGAGISNQVNNTMDRKKVEKIVQDYQEKMEDINKCLTFIKQGIENLRRFDLIKMKNSAYNQDFPSLTSRFYEDGAMAGKAILLNANEIMRFVQFAHVAGSTAARAVQIASMATGVLSGLFVVMDIYFVSKDSKELKKGAKSEFAAKIREVAQQLHDGLVELNSIHQELQFNSPEKDSEKTTKDLDSEKKEKDNKEKKEKDGKDLNSEKKNNDSSDEDEIDRIKKAIKKDLENREYV
ncbi:probable serine/threonine-protein kinase kinX isoform X2 [Neolamprologus brichardi]|uniref:probable serine/threonine-protein kinase kinX isoform X2 n=1 Tax=Neolamprologus brichardi TaxID=32507 RepID=UPI001643E235|nr:probable serine/threonine-protein kinase kinX isoform X2 [Neolamprologus brichardi]